MIARPRTRGVLLLGNYPPPYGGVPTHIEQLSKYLSTREWNVHVLTAGTTDLKSSVTVENGVHVHRLSRAARLLELLRPWQGSMWRRPFLRRFGLRERLSIETSASYAATLIRREHLSIVSAYQPLLAGVVGALLAERFGLSLLTTIFGGVYRAFEYHQKHVDALKFVVAGSRRMLSCSDYCGKSLERLGMNVPVQTLYYGVDLNRFHPRQDPCFFRRKFDLNPDTPIVLYLARMTEEMGLRVLLEAIPAVLSERDDIVFVIAGQRAELTGKALEASAAFRGKVVVYPDVDGEELPLVYAAASLVVVPSLNERACFGLAIAEAMATGKATVVADVGGAREIAVDRVSRFVAPRDSSALARAVVDLLAQPDRLVEMGAHGRTRVESFFSLDQTHIAMEKLLEGCLNG